MFRGLKGRQVVITTTGPEGFRGTVASAGLFTIRLRDFEVVAPANAGPAAGVARTPRRTITWIQEL